jgi:hypothetical protein
MASTARPLGSLSMARGCARIDAGPDTAKIGSADRVQDHARLLAVIGVRKTFPHGLDRQRTFRFRPVSYLPHCKPIA